MSRFYTLSLLVMLFSACARAEEIPAGQQAPASELKTTRQQASYAIGMDIGSSMAQSGIFAEDVSPEAIAQGIADALSKAKPQLSEEQLEAAMQAFQKQLAEKAAERRTAVAEANLKEGREFLAENKKRKGVETLESGLQYEVIKSGDGASPKAADTVKTHYHGTLLDGTVFDSSVQRGEPATFPVGGVIGGWTEALQLMQVGDKWRLFVPPNLAYGERGAGGAIGPNATLVFEVELLGIE